MQEILDSSKYSRYATNLADDVQVALDELNELLSVEFDEHKTHCVIEICDFEERQEVVVGIAVYLVGAIASCVECNLDIRRALFDEETGDRDLYHDVVDVIGEDNSISNEKKTTERDPWLWEGISHLLFHLSRTDEEKHPPSRIIAKTSIHLDVKDHGLDLIALYGTDELGVSAGECKAYLERASDAIADAANRLGEVDEKLRDAEIRAAMSQFRPSLTADQREKLVGSFWHGERAYFPMVCCDKEHKVNWSKKRKVITRLKPPRDKKHLVPAAIEDAKSFFDEIADEMREYADDETL